MIAPKQVSSTLLGIAFETGRVHVAQVRRNGQPFAVGKHLQIPLPEGLSHATAQPAGLEIRRVLQQHDLKEHRCVVALPVQWALSLPARIPDLAEADIPGFLALEAERNLAYDPESLFVSVSRCRSGQGEQFASIAAIPREQVLLVQSMLQAARLKPLSITIGLGAILQVLSTSAEVELLLAISRGAVEVGIPCGDGLYAMRSFEQSVDSLDAALIGRELRVTLGQLPAEVRGKLVTARLFGAPELCARTKTMLAPGLRTLGLAAEVSPLNSEASPAAVAAAASVLLGKKPSFEFLPPKVSAWKQFAGKASARKLAWAAGIAAAVLVLLLGAVLLQSWRLSRLQSRWAAMSPRVTELDEMQQRIKKFRPWFDSSFRSLTILRKLTEAFPADGAVTAKTLEIRNQSQVTCSGVARDNQTLFKMLDQLRNTKEVADVKMEQIRGKSPLQFNFNYRWVEGGTGER